MDQAITACCAAPVVGRHTAGRSRSCPALIAGVRQLDPGQRRASPHGLAATCSRQVSHLAEIHSVRAALQRAALIDKTAHPCESGRRSPQRTAVQAPSETNKQEKRQSTASPAIAAVQDGRPARRLEEHLSSACGVGSEGVRAGHMQAAWPSCPQLPRCWGSGPTHAPPAA